MESLEETTFRLRVKIMTPSSISFQEFTPQEREYNCYFCHRLATQWMQRVYSFGADSTRVCGECRSVWQGRAKNA